MDKKFKIAHLLGIVREHEQQFRDVEKWLTKQGYIVFAPVFYDYTKYKSFGETPNMLDDMCTQKLHMCDFLVIVTPDHIGKSTTARIKQACEMGKPVYVVEDGRLVEMSPIYETKDGVLVKLRPGKEPENKTSLQADERIWLKGALLNAGPKAIEKFISDRITRQEHEAAIAIDSMLDEAMSLMSDKELEEVLKELSIKRRP